MFGIAPSEIILLLVVAVALIGPKDLPKVMRVAGRWIGRARAVKSHFRAGIDELIRQSELDELQMALPKQEEGLELGPAVGTSPRPAGNIAHGPSLSEGKVSGEEAS